MTMLLVMNLGFAWGEATGTVVTNAGQTTDIRLYKKLRQRYGFI